MAPPVRVRVEISKEAAESERQQLQEMIENAIHHHLRFRARPEFIKEGEFHLITGATGKARLVEEAK